MIINYNLYIVDKIAKIKQSCTVIIPWLLRIEPYCINMDPNKN